MPTADKLRWIDALYAAGVREIEVASFVPAKLLPQMADAAEVVRHAVTLPGLTVMALVPNRKGAQAALDAGVHKLTMPVSASVAHSLANVRKTPTEMVGGGARHFRPAPRHRAAGEARGGHLDGFRLHAAGPGARRRRDPPGRAMHRGGRRRIGAVRHRRLCQSGAGAASVQAPARGAGHARRRGPHAQHARPRPRELPRGVGTKACAPSTPRSAASAAALTRRARRAMPSPKTSSSCSRPWACAPASTFKNSSRRGAPLMAGLPGEPVYGMTPEAGLPKGFVQEPIPHV